MGNLDLLKKALAEDIAGRQNETRRVLDALRKTRRARGGTGAPLEQPAHLRNPIFVTDAELADGLRLKSVAGD